MRNTIPLLPRLSIFILILLLLFWAFNQDFSPTLNAVIIVGGFLAVFPTVWLGRRWLDADPSAERTIKITAIVHAILMILMGLSIIKAVQTGRSWQGWVIPFSPKLGLLLVQITAFATLLTVLNLALRGLGAPFAVALSRRLATDWMYRWTRNPMVLATLALLIAFGLWYESLLFILWVLLLVTPAWIAFLKVYEERELEIRFGQPYLDYREKTSFLIPRKPRD